MAGVDMISKLQSTIDEHGLLEPGQHVLVAVSGGADSVALLHGLLKFSKSLDLRVSVAHLNHRIRGKTADGDAEFVRSLTRRLKVRCYVGRYDVPRLAKRRKISLEMAAREARYVFLGRIARKCRADVVATAHTADDQAETILLRLVRGAGATGLGGIRYRAEIGGLTVVRPMLDVGKSEVVEFLRGIHETWREDESNRDLEFQRNIVRCELLPMLESRLNPSVRKALTQAGRILRDEDEWLESLASSILTEHSAGSSPWSLPIKVLAGLPVAAQRRVLRLWLAGSGVPAESVDFDAVARVLKAATSSRGGVRIMLAGGRAVAKCGGNLEVAGRNQLKSRPFCAIIKLPGVTAIAGNGLRIVTTIEPGIVRERALVVGQLPARASISLGALDGRKLRVRSWRPGDRISPFGFGGSMKIQDVFTNGRVPREERGIVPIVECDGEIVWVPGYRIARGWEVRKEAEPAIQILME